VTEYVPGVEEENVQAAGAEPPPGTTTEPGQATVRPVGGITVFLSPTVPANPFRLRTVIADGAEPPVTKLTGTVVPDMAKSPTRTVIKDRWNKVPSVTLNVTP